MNQISFFDGKNQFKITNKIRLIEKLYKSVDNLHEFSPQINREQQELRQ